METDIIESRKTSVVICTFEREQSLELCITSVLNQHRSVREILVIDNGIDQRAEYVTNQLRKASGKNRVPISVIENPSGNSLTAGRNLGVQACTGKIVLFIDDDVVLDAGYVEAIERVFENSPGILGVQGVWEHTPDRGIKQWLKRVFREYRTGPNESSLNSCVTGSYPSSCDTEMPAKWFCGFNQAYRIGVFESCLFDEKLIGYSDGEDLDFSVRVARLGSSVLRITPSAQLAHIKANSGRLSQWERTVMQEINSFYLFHKLFPDTGISANAILCWNRFGRLLLSIYRVVFERRLTGAVQFGARFFAFGLCALNHKQIKSGDLAALYSPRSDTSPTSKQK